MPSKKKKYNARFPPARIKKIMQTDEDVGKVAAAVPVIISRSLELFIDSFIQKTATITKGRNAKTLSAAHIKQTIYSEKTFDFLRDLVANVPDHQPEEDADSNASVPSSSTGQEVKKQKIQRPRKEKSGNGRGRPRKKDVVVQEKEDTETEEDDEETESDSSQTNTEQFQAPSDTSWTHPLNMQAPAQSSPYTIGSSANSTSQMNPGFTASSNLANLMPPSIPQHNPTSPRLPMLQSPPDFSNISMMPRPQLQNMSSQLPPPQQQFSGLTNQIPPPPLLTNFSNQLPGQPNFYQAHQLQMQQYPKINSQETFQSDQKSFMPSREAPSFSQTPSCPQFKQEEVNPDRSLGNIVTNNEPLDMSRSSLSQRSYASDHEVDPGKNKGMPISLTGLSNIMNMTISKPLTDDDDYDT